MFEMFFYGIEKKDDLKEYFINDIPLKESLNKDEIAIQFKNNIERIFNKYPFEKINTELEKELTDKQYEEFLEKLAVFSYEGSELAVERYSK